MADQNSGEQPTNPPELKTPGPDLRVKPVGRTVVTPRGYLSPFAVERYGKLLPDVLSKFSAGYTTAGGVPQVVTSVEPFWENPYRVAAYYNRYKSSGEVPPGIEPQQLEEAYNYLSERNQNKPPEQWQRLPKEDPGNQFLQKLPTPPVEYLWPEDVKKFAEQEAIKTARAPVQGNVITPAEFEDMPGLAKALVTLTTAPSPSAPYTPSTTAARLAMAGGAGLAVGSITSFMATPLVGAIVGAAVTAEQMYRYSTGKEVPLLSDAVDGALSLLNAPAQWTEQLVGTAALLATGPDGKDLASLVQELPTAMQASKMTYEALGAQATTQLIGAAIGQKVSPGEVFHFEMGISEPVRAQYGTGIDALTAYEHLLRQGTDPLEAQQAFASSLGISGVMSDFALQTVLDPLNFMNAVGPASVKQFGKVLGSERLEMAGAAAMGNPIVDLLPFPINMVGGLVAKPSTGLLGAFQNYKVYTQTGVFRPSPKAAPFVKAMTEAPVTSRVVSNMLGLTPDGRLLAATPSDAPKGLGRWFSKQLTPESRALQAFYNASDVGASHIANATSVDDIISAAKSLSNANGAAAGKLLNAIVGATPDNPHPTPPAIATAIDSLSNYFDDGGKAMNTIRLYQSTEGQRATLSRLAGELGDSPQNVVRTLRDLDPNARRARLSTSQVAQEMGVDKLLGSLEPFYRAKQPAQISLDELKSDLISGMTNYLNDTIPSRFGVKEPGALRKLQHTLKQVQMPFLLGMSPRYLINNTINNAITLLADGNAGKPIRSLSTAQKTLDKYGLKLSWLGVDPNVHPAFRTNAQTLLGNLGVSDSKLSKAINLFGTISGQMEQTSRLTAGVNTAVDTFAQVWKPGKAIRAMPMDLRMALGEDLANSIVRSVVNDPNNIDALLAGRPDQIKQSVASLVRETTDSLLANIDIPNKDLVFGDIATEITNEIDNRLTGKTLVTPDDVDTIVDGIYDDFVNKWAEGFDRLIDGARGAAAEQARAEGAPGLLEHIAQSEMMRNEYWTVHTIETQRIWNMDPQRRPAAWERLNQRSRKQFADLNAMLDNSMSAYVDELVRLTNESNLPDDVKAARLQATETIKASSTQIWEPWQRAYEARDRLVKRYNAGEITWDELQAAQAQLYDLAGTAEAANRASVMSAMETLLPGNVQQLREWGTRLAQIRDEMSGSIRQLRQDAGSWYEYMLGPNGHIAHIDDLTRTTLEYAQRMVDPLVDTPVGSYNGPLNTFLAYNEGFLENVSPMLDAIRQRMYQGLGETIGPLPAQTTTALRRWLNEVKAQDLPTARITASKVAQMHTNFSLLDYGSRSYFDEWMSYIWPYSFWSIHTVRSWALRLFQNPSMFAFYGRLRDMQDTYEADWIPQRLKNKVFIPFPMPEWMGQGLYIDPTQQLFPPFQLLQPFYTNDYMNTNRQYAIEDTIRRWQKDGTITDQEAQDALAKREGPVWQQAEQEAMGNEFSDPMNLASMMMLPAMYVTVPYYLATGQAERITPTPWMRMSQALGVVTPEPLGRVLSAPATLEEKIRQSMGMTPEIARWGEYGTYYIDSRLAQMVAEGTITEREAVEAMINRSGPAWEQAFKQVDQMIASRQPGIAAVLSANAGATPPQLVSAIFASLFPTGLLSKGELIVKGNYDEYQHAWEMYNKGEKRPLQDFFNNHPEYEVRSALYAETPEERLRQFMIGIIWDEYNNLSDANKKVVVDQLGDDFVTYFLDKDTRAEDAVSTQTLVDWAQALGSGVTINAYPSEAKPVETLPPQVTSAYDAYVTERDRRFPNWNAYQTEYYSLPPEQRQGYLAEHPVLQAYWDWNRQYLKEHPEVQVAKATGTSQSKAPMGLGSLPDTVISQLGDYYTGRAGLRPGGTMFLEQIWETLGKPEGTLQKWIDGPLMQAYFSQR